MIQLGLSEIRELLTPVTTADEVAALEKGTLSNEQRTALRARIERRQKLMKNCVPEGGWEAVVLMNLNKVV